MIGGNICYERATKGMFVLYNESYCVSPLTYLSSAVVGGAIVMSILKHKFQAHEVELEPLVFDTQDASVDDDDDTIMDMAGGDYQQVSLPLYDTDMKVASVTPSKDFVRYNARHALVRSLVDVEHYIDQYCQDRVRRYPLKKISLTIRYDSSVCDYDTSQLINAMVKAIQRNSVEHHHIEVRVSHNTRRFDIVGIVAQAGMGHENSIQLSEGCSTNGYTIYSAANNHESLSGRSGIAA